MFQCRAPVNTVLCFGCEGRCSKTCSRPPFPPSTSSRTSYCTVMAMSYFASLSRVCVLLIWILQLADVSDALVHAQPSPTPPNWDIDHMGDGWSPRPTDSPFYNLATVLAQDALVGRQVANLHTCGFIDGNADHPITCAAGQGCVTFGADPGK